MPTLSTAEMTALHAELQGSAYAAMTDAQRFDAMHVAGSIANPNAAGQVPKPFTLTDVMGCLSAASLVNIRDIADRGNLYDTINMQDRAGLGHWAYILSVSPPLITAAEVQAVNTVLAATQTDPNWPATVPGPSRKVALFGPKSWTKADGSVVDFITLEDISAAR